jgi:hypothetical protein
MVIGPPHHPHVEAASLRACAVDSTWGTEPAPVSPDGEQLGRGGNSCLAAPTRVVDRRDALRRLLMPGMVRMDVPADVTPMRHDGTARPGA